MLSMHADTSQAAMPCTRADRPAGDWLVRIGQAAAPARWRGLATDVMSVIAFQRAFVARCAGRGSCCRRTLLPSLVPALECSYHLHAVWD